MRFQTGFILLTSAAMLAACTNPDGSHNHRTTGTILGTAAGVAIGAGPATGIGTAAGAALGNVVGSAAGALLDRQQKELNAELADTGATVVNTGSILVVTLPESVTFDSGSARLHQDYVDEIAFIARSLRDHPNSIVTVVGHTDNVGSTKYNQGLSERRAAAVANVLTESGVEATRMHSIGMGYHQPVASNDTPGGRAQNRRVEIIITPTV
ncbi:outer membrane protein OmpA-like peptidoglycan-associated protein [Amaricoccus macauensis]|uniref:Outer membrane protein OmpA-like peptidoglycan-associated protein n=1 Tax=Amaricoccus macauensis TaxID=57001 RepID=A0A840SYA6_9RHOB|nr:OmpA family protein [Amaricoccus macauensis]MBB5224091.1 outer membrane protein OmpA-like peptidoglycan-associated protein [Amaricoccus macauensis]